MQELDKLDLELLTLAQRGLPILSEPYRALGLSLGLSPAQVLERLNRYQKEKLVRRISGFFYAPALGYTSLLCAIRVDPEHVEEMADYLFALPGVTHNYLRDHSLNMWFTLSSPGEEAQERTLQGIMDTGYPKELIRLPSRRTFKIRASFDLRQDPLKEESPSPAQEESLSPSPFTAPREPLRPLTEKDIGLIRLLQESFPLEELPFQALGQALGLSQEEALSITERLFQEGRLKRIAAALHHHRAGYRFNSLLAWDVAQERLEEAGKAAASFSQVTHCYERVASPSLDYNLYTMVHETSQENLDRLVEQLRQVIHPKKYLGLPTLRELKKEPMKYFASCSNEHI